MSCSWYKLPPVMFCHFNWWRCQLINEKPDNDTWVLSKLVFANKSGRRETKGSIIDLFASELKHFTNRKPDPKWSCWNCTGLISWHLLASESWAVLVFTSLIYITNLTLWQIHWQETLRLTDCKCVFQGGTLKDCWSPTSMNTKLPWTASESPTNTPSLLRRPMTAPLKSGTVRRWRERPRPPGESRPETGCSGPRYWN